MFRQSYPSKLRFALVLIAGCLPAAAVAQTSFQTHAVTASSSSLYEIAGHGDFNGDGREDLIVTLITPGQASQGYMLLSNGDGTYDTPRALADGLGQGGVVIGDFNADGKLDAAAQTGGTSVSVFLGNGDGTFQAPKSFTTPVNGLGLVAQDMNHDGKTDLVGVYDGPTITLQVWLSNGDGTFAKGQTTYPYNPNQSGFLDGLLAGDFDGDGKPDVAVEYSQEGPTSVQVWYGDGAGNLGSPFLIHDANGYEDSLTVADINNDGKDDLIGSAFRYGVSGTSQFFPTSVTFTGNANRTLTYGTLTTGGCASIPAVADFNGDGINDLAYLESPCNASGPGQTLVVRPGTGGGAFGAEQTVGQSAYGYAGLNAIRSSSGTRPDLVTVQETGPAPSGQFSPTEVTLLSNETSGKFPGCGADAAEGIRICVPAGASATSPVQFSIGAAGPTPMRTVAVWVDGGKVAEQLTHAFSNYSFLDASVSIGTGTHTVDVYGTGWDNTLQHQQLILTVGASSSGGCAAPSSPGVNICTPVNYSTDNSPVSVTAAANITGTLARMEIWSDGVKVYTETTSKSLTDTLSLSPGSHVIDVYAANTAGGLWKSTANITVSGVSCAAPSSPGVHVCSPINGSTVGSPVTVTASATITALARMEIWVDGSKKYTETTSTTFSAAVPLSSGYHRFDIYAVNTAGTKYESTVYATVK